MLNCLVLPGKLVFECVQKRASWKTLVVTKTIATSLHFTLDLVVKAGFGHSTTEWYDRN